jgi:hypothetical protein
MRTSDIRLSVYDWVQGSGYITLREWIQRAEEALIPIAPLETVIAGAWEDELRLRGANIDNRDELLNRLREAREALEGLLEINKNLRAEASSEPKVTSGAEAPPATKVILARQTLRYVRRAINDFRDEKRSGLIRARNRLIRSITLTGLVGFSLMAIAILMGAPPKSLIAATAFYLVGAIMGLFTKRPPAESWWVQKLSADLTAD